MFRNLRLIGLFMTVILLWFGMVCNRPISAAPISNGVAVLLFHQVTPGITNSVTMSPQDFETTLTSLKEQGYNFINLQTMHDYMDGKVNVPAKSVLITFDDGYKDVYTYAHPLLLKHGVPAVMFPITMYYQSDYQLPVQFTPHLSTEDTIAMLRSGIWGFGGHSFDGHRQILISSDHYGAFYTHSAWLGTRQESELEYVTRIESDVSSMVDTLRSLSLGTVDFAPPSGAINTTLQQVLDRQGIKYVYTQAHRLNQPGSKRIYRLTASYPDQVLSDLNLLFTAQQTSLINSEVAKLSSSLSQSLYNNSSFLRRGWKKNE